MSLCLGADAHAAVIVAGGTGGGAPPCQVAVIPNGDAPCEIDSPLHRRAKELEGPVPSAGDSDVGAPQSCLGADAQAAVNVAGGTAVVTVAATEKVIDRFTIMMTTKRYLSG